MLYCTRYSSPYSDDLTCIDSSDLNKQIIVPKDKLRYMVDFQEIYSVRDSIIIVPDILLRINTKEKFLQSCLSGIIKGYFLGDIYYAQETIIGSYSFMSDFVRFFNGLEVRWDGYFGNSRYNDYLEYKDFRIGMVTPDVSPRMRQFFEKLGVKVGKSGIIFYKNCWYLSMTCDCDKDENIRVVVCKDLLNLDSIEYKVLVTDLSGKVLKELDFN